VQQAIFPKPDKAVLAPPGRGIKAAMGSRALKPTTEAQAVAAVLALRVHSAQAVMVAMVEMALQRRFQEQKFLLAAVAAGLHLVRRV
jgi:hypothetical protein